MGTQANPKGPRIDADVLKKLDENRPDWSRLWSAIALVQAGAEPAVELALFAADPSTSKMIRDVRDASSLSKIVAGVRRLASNPELSSAWRVLEFEGIKSNKTLVLVFDQLDIALGSGPAKRARRKALIEGLLEASSSWRDSRHLGAKIFLREDLWNEIEFEEKAKYATRIVTLTWSQQEIWRLCIRAFSVGSATFRRHLFDRMGIDVDKLEEATEEQQRMALTLIWGERMGGTESDTFSVSWAYRRLHDGQGRLFPRAALWLLVFAIREQKNLGIRDMPPLLSPDALRAAMPNVAASRLEELRAEAPSDWKLISSLKEFPSYLALPSREMAIHSS